MERLTGLCIPSFQVYVDPGLVPAGVFFPQHELELQYKLPRSTHNPPRPKLEKEENIIKSDLKQPCSCECVHRAYLVVFWPVPD